MRDLFVSATSDEIGSMTGYCEDCGNQLCICDLVRADSKRTLSLDNAIDTLRQYRVERDRVAPQRPYTSLSDPADVIRRLDAIERDLAVRQNALEAAASAWFEAKRDREHARAIAYMQAEGSVEARKAQADIATALDGKEAEAEWEALRAVVRTLETRASVLQSVLRAQGRV